MKIACLCPSLSRSYGGIFEIERRVAQSLSEIPDTEVEVFGTADEFTESDSSSWGPISARSFRYFGPAAFRYSPGLSRAFLSSEADLAHLHGLWLHTSMIVSKWAKTKKRPYITTIHGMLEPWAIRNSHWKKRISSLVYENAALRGAACLQANSTAELASIRAYGLRNPVCVIPNGIDLPLPVGETTNAVSESLFPRGCKVLLYLGRLHPKKGLENLLHAWAGLRQSQNTRVRDWVLAIAGWDQGGHEAHLMKMAVTLGIPIASRSSLEVEAGSIKFLGPLFGAAKAAAYFRCDAFILPSFSEGLPMAVLEAWSYEKPVLMTPECNLSEGFTVGAALRIEANRASIKAGIEQLLAMTSLEKKCLGASGLNLVVERFTWPEVARELRAVYHWMLGGGLLPASIDRGRSSLI